MANGKRVYLVNYEMKVGTYIIDSQLILEANRIQN